MLEIDVRIICLAGQLAVQQGFQLTGLQIGRGQQDGLGNGQAIAHKDLLCEIVDAFAPAYAGEVRSW